LLFIWIETVIGKPYVYSSNDVIGMSVSDMIVDDSGKELSVLSIDFGMNNFVAEVFKEQDLYNNTSIYEGYSVLFHADNRTVPKYLYLEIFKIHAF